MLISAAAKKFLDTHKVVYQVLHHETGRDLAEVAKYLHLDSGSFLRAVVLEDEYGAMLFTLPLLKPVPLTRLRQLLMREVSIVADNQQCDYFYDCEPGANPPLGEAYELPWIIDMTIFKKEMLYFSGGSHCSLIKISAEEFRFLSADAKLVAFNMVDSKISHLLG